MRVSVKVNGTPASSDVEPGLLLIDYLREQMLLTGAKVGCDTGHCGACVVRVDGETAKSCLMLAAQADGSTVDTIEGLGSDGELTALQEALYDEHGTQCGFCTPGVVMTLTSMLEREPNPAEEQVRSWLSGNLCRCTGYQSIVRAVLRLAKGEDDG
jgi:aerobic carbon-monoxide dehydrogenase small subunit